MEHVAGILRKCKWTHADVVENFGQDGVWYDRDGRKRMKIERALDNNGVEDCSLGILVGRLANGGRILEGRERGSFWGVDLCLEGWRCGNYVGEGGEDRSFCYVWGVRRVEMKGGLGKNVKDGLRFGCVC